MENKKEKKSARVEARMTPADKNKLEELAAMKGCNGITGLLNLLACAKDVDIKI